METNPEEEKDPTPEIRAFIIKMLHVRPNGLKETTILEALGKEQDRREAWGTGWEFLGVDLLFAMVVDGTLVWNTKDIPLDQPLTYKLASLS